MVLRIETEEEKINKDFVWTVKNSIELQEKYEGRWIAIINKKVVGVGKDAKEAYSNAKKNVPKREPLLNFIPKKELLVL